MTLDAFLPYKDEDRTVDLAACFPNHYSRLVICCRLNAFDLINLVGGLALDNLFNFHKGSHVSWKYVVHGTALTGHLDGWFDCFAC